MIASSPCRVGCLSGSQHFGIATCLAALVTLVALLPWSHAHGEQQSPATLTSTVKLVGANAANDALSLPVPPGASEQDLYLQVGKAFPKQQTGRLVISKLQAQTPPLEVTDASIRPAEATATPSAAAPMEVTISPSGLIHLKLRVGPFRPGTAYKGTLFLSSGGESVQWEITTSSGAGGVIAVVPIGTQKFVSYPLKDPVGSFPITIYDKSGTGPYSHLRLRFEPTGAPASKAVTTNFSLNTFTFLDSDDPAAQSIDLAQSGGPPSNTSRAIDLSRRAQRRLTGVVGHLSPGEYSGDLRISSTETSDDAAEAKLPITIQVRHHWLIPALVIVLGSLVGWFTSKYIVALRKKRELVRALETLRARASDLARVGVPTGGWEFPGEATSCGLVRVSVLLSHLAKLAETVTPILVHEEAINQQRQDIESRVDALERLREARLQAQCNADGKPAVQVTLGRLLRRASDILERPTFGTGEQAKFNSFLQVITTWNEKPENYKTSLIERLTNQEVPTVLEAQSLSDGELKTQLVKLRQGCPTPDGINGEVDLDKLRDFDQAIAKTALLWRERNTAWGQLLAEACKNNSSLTELFHLVDQELWETLKVAVQADQVAIEPARGQQQWPSYDLVEIRLTCNCPDLSVSRILYHPLHIVWRITPPKGVSRSSESHALTLVQYFPETGPVTIEARLRWNGDEIPLPRSVALTVTENKEYRSSRLLYSGGFSEWLVIVVAAGFALVTGMNAQYDSTFGSLNQYIGLFLWAAGAGTGGNLFKQLGTTSTVGGQTEVPLPTKVGG